MGQSAVQLISGLITVIWVTICMLVALNARKRGMSAIGWFLGVLLAPIIFLPLYLIMRKPLVETVPDEEEEDRKTPLVSTLRGGTPTSVPTSVGCPLAGRKVRTLDDALLVYQDRDLSSGVVARPPNGTEVQLGSLSELDGREWLEAVLPNGDKGYVLGVSVRSHAT